MAAHSSGVAKRRRMDDGRAVEKNSRSAVAKSTPRPAAICDLMVVTFSEAVGPGSTLLTVTPVPASVSARPRATASCGLADAVMDHLRGDLQPRFAGYENDAAPVARAHAFDIMPRQAP